MPLLRVLHRLVGLLSDDAINFQYFVHLLPYGRDHADGGDVGARLPGLTPVDISWVSWLEPR